MSLNVREKIKKLNPTRRKRVATRAAQLLSAAQNEAGPLTQPTLAGTVEKYSMKRKAELLLSTATTRKDYQQARKAVQRLGVDPDTIPHRRPK